MTEIYDTYWYVTPILIFICFAIVLLMRINTQAQSQQFINYNDTKRILHRINPESTKIDGIKESYMTNMEQLQKQFDVMKLIYIFVFLITLFWFCFNIKFINLWFNF